MTNRKHWICNVTALAFIALFTASAPAQTIWYVDDNAPNDPGPGDPAVSDAAEDGSADHPFDAIQEGIDAATAGNEVVVQQGTYTGDGNRNLDFQGKAITVRSANGPATTVIDCGGSACGFNVHSDETNTSVVDGLTIRNGDNTGGIYCTGGSPTIRSCVLADNVGYGATFYRNASVIEDCMITGNGAGIFICAPNVVVSHCTIEENDFGISLIYYAGTTVHHCTISKNMGAGIILSQSSPTITHCTISQNTGHGIRCYEDSDATISDCTISGNTAEYGAGVYVQASAPTIMNCTILDNTAEYGAGMLLWGDAIVANCLIAGNTATVDQGGGIRCSPRSPSEIIQCTIVDNTAAQFGGGVSCAGYTDPETSTLTNCILWGNSAPQGPQIALINSWHSGGPAKLDISYSDVQGGEPAAYVEEGSTLTWGSGNINNDPLFADPDGPDDDPATYGNNDYHLSNNSPCIDAGNNMAVPLDLVDLDNDGDTTERAPLDLNGTPRFIDDTAVSDTGVSDPPNYPDVVDIGTYEYDPLNITVPGDFNGDGDVDLGDFEQFEACLSGPTVPYTGNCSDADFDTDSDVDQSDFGIFQRCYSGEDNPANPNCADLDLPTEACCFSNGSCSDMTEAACIASGGTPQGPSSDCSTAECPQPPETEACCFPDGSCSDLTEAECTSEEGVAQGAETDCATAVCPPALPACCFPDGSCSHLLEFDCLVSGGFPQGPGTNCSIVICPQP